MEDIKKEFCIVEDYSISETTLEQVFISFAKQQQSFEEKHVNAEDEEHSNEPYFRQKSLVRHLSNMSHTSDGYTHFT